MKKTANTLPSLFQFILTFVILFITFLSYAVLDVNEADMINTVGFVIFQPLLAFLFSILSIAVCFVIGLPIRFNDKINRWWKTKPLIPVIGFAIVVLPLMLAFNPNLTATKEIMLNEEMMKKEVPDLATFVTGWFLVAFFPFKFLSVFFTKPISQIEVLPAVRQSGFTFRD